MAELSNWNIQGFDETDNSQFEPEPGIRVCIETVEDIFLT